MRRFHDPNVRSSPLTSRGDLEWVLRKKDMPKKQVYECECDRCGKKWYPEPVDGKAPPVASLDLSFQDIEAGWLTKFEVLCEGCATTVRNYIRLILKLPKDSEAKENGDGETPANVSPPEPSLKR